MSLRGAVAAYAPELSTLERRHSVVQRRNKGKEKEINAQDGDEFDAEFGILGRVQDGLGHHHVCDSHCARGAQHWVAAMGVSICTVGILVFI